MVNCITVKLLTAKPCLKYLGAYIRPVLGKLMKDERVDNTYRDWAHKILN